MKRVIYLCLVCVALVALVSCSTTTQQSNEEPQVTIYQTVAPVEPDTTSSKAWYDLMAAPAGTEDYHYAFGLGTGSTLITAKKFAEAQANAAIAQWVQNAVDLFTDTYMNDAGSGADMQAVQAFEELYRGHASAILTGVETIDTHQYTVSNGYQIGVLVQIPVGKVADELKELVEEAGFVKSEAAEEANRMMDEAIKKFTSN